jgi:ribosome-binding factor A
MEGKSQRQLKVNEELKKVAQDFFQRNSSGAAMITVTSADVSKDLKKANIYITVLPQEKESSALDFAKRMRSDMRTDIKKRLPIKSIPFVEIEIDEGEKNRQRIESLLLKDRLDRPSKNIDQDEIEYL